jgi:hypothetical protein
MKKKRKPIDFSSMSFDLDNILNQNQSPDVEKEFIKAARLNYEPVCFDNAVEAAGVVDYQKDYFCFVSGKFIFGDFIEALLFKKALNPKRVYITTLGMSAENIDSIVNLTVLGAEEVNLIWSGNFLVKISTSRF